MAETNYQLPHVCGHNTEDTAADVMRLRMEKAALRPYRTRLEALQERALVLNQCTNAAADVTLRLHHKLQAAETAMAKRWPRGRPERDPEDYDLAADELAELREQKASAEARRDAASEQWRPMGALVARCEEWLEKNQRRIVHEYIAQQEVRTDDAH